MRMVSKYFTIELDEKEIEVLTTALHNEYLDKRHEKPGSEEVSILKDTRNVLGSLINRSWMGQDA